MIGDDVCSKPRKASRTTASIPQCSTRCRARWGPAVRRKCSRRRRPAAPTARRTQVEHRNSATGTSLMPTATGSAMRRPQAKRMARMILTEWRSIRSSARRPCRATGGAEQRVPVTAAEPEPHLIAHHRTQRGDADQHGKIEIAAMRGITRQQQHGFAFEQAADEYGGIAILRNEGGNIHAWIVERAARDKMTERSLACHRAQSAWEKSWASWVKADGGRLEPADRASLPASPHGSYCC